MPTKVEVETNTEVLIDIWNQIIGPKRVNLEVKHAEEELLRQAREKCESVLHLLLKLSHTDVLKQLAYIQAALLEGMGRTRLCIYRKSWRSQGHVETSESLDAIWKYGLVPVFDWCRENIERLLNKQMMYDKIPMLNLVRTGMGFFDEKASEFRKRLQEEVEIAKPFQVQASKTEQVQVEVAAPSVAINQKEQSREGQRGQKADRKQETVAKHKEWAKTVATIHKELSTLKPQMYGEDSYNELKAIYPKYLVFQIAETRPALKLRVENIMMTKQHLHLAKELTAGSCGRSYESIRKAWISYKPASFSDNPT